MIKTTFDEAFAKQLAPRTVLPAEACSELGVASTRTRAAKRVSRWLPQLRRWLTDRWFGGRRSGVHG